MSQFLYWTRFPRPLQQWFNLLFLQILSFHYNKSVVAHRKRTASILLKRLTRSLRHWIHPVEAMFVMLGWSPSVGRLLLLTDPQPPVSALLRVLSENTKKEHRIVTNWLTCHTKDYNQKCGKEFLRNWQLLNLIKKKKLSQLLWNLMNHCGAHKFSS
jgi:hypothetical protein